MRWNWPNVSSLGRELRFQLPVLFVKREHMLAQVQQHLVCLTDLLLQFIVRHALGEFTRLL